MDGPEAVPAGERTRPSPGAKFCLAACALLAVVFIHHTQRKGPSVVSERGATLSVMLRPGTSMVTGLIKTRHQSLHANGPRVGAISAAVSLLQQPSLLAKLQEDMSLQRLLEQEIPGSDNASMVIMDDAPNYCTAKAEFVATSPMHWYCGVCGGTGEPGRVDTCAKCNETVNCLGPAAALENLGVANSSEPFRGWNPQGGGESSDTQSLTLQFPLRAVLVKAILWANAGDTAHDPTWIRVFSSSDGTNWQLVNTVNTTSLQGSAEIHILPLHLDATKATSAKFWRINPGGIAMQSIPRSVGLCPTVDCTGCAPESSPLAAKYLWASDQAGSTYSQWLEKQPVLVE